MELILRPRQAGKTTDLIKMCNKNWGYIVCATRQEADRVFRHAHKLKIDIPLPITWEEFLRGTYGHGCKQFYIDNLDLCIQNHSRLPIRAVTMTEDK